MTEFVSGEGRLALHHAARSRYVSDEAYRVLALVASEAVGGPCKLSNAELGEAMNPRREAGVVQAHLKALSASGYLSWTGTGAKRKLVVW